MINVNYESLEMMVQKALQDELAKMKDRNVSLTLTMAQLRNIIREEMREVLKHYQVGPRKEMSASQLLRIQNTAAKAKKGALGKK